MNEKSVLVAGSSHKILAEQVSRQTNCPLFPLTVFHFPDGGDLVDSPGIREFGLWHMDREQVLNGFIEFQPFLGSCKFRDCQHQSEPGCEIRAALERGDISERRLNSFEMIVNSLEQL